MSNYITTVNTKNRELHAKICENADKLGISKSRWYQMLGTTSINKLKAFIKDVDKQ